MAEIVNRDRKRNGLPPLAYDERLAEAARSHSADMHANHFFSHDSPTYGDLVQRLTRAGYLFLASRENLAEAPTIEEAEVGLLNSPHHYENLMAQDITRIGIGIVRGGPSDPRNLAITQMFATPGKSESDAEAELQVARAIRAARAKNGVQELARNVKLDAKAKQYLEGIPGELNESGLKPVAKAIAEELGKMKLTEMRRVSVGGQVVLDSSQFQVEGALLQASARGYGLAVTHTKDQRGTPRLKVLFLVGLGQ